MPVRFFSGKRSEDWQVEDPTEATSLAEVRRTRNDIDDRVRRLVAELGVSVAAG